VGHPLPLCLQGYSEGPRSVRERLRALRGVDAEGGEIGEGHERRAPSQFCKDIFNPDISAAVFMLISG